MPETRPKIKIGLSKMFPDGFDAHNPDDMMRLTRKIQEKAARQPEKYEGYLIDSISPDGLYAYIAPMAMSTDDKEMQKLLTEGMAHGDEIDAADCMGEARQKDTVARIELNYANSTDPTIKHVSGMTWKVIDFIPRTSSKSVVLLQLMDDKTISIRQQFAEALGLQKYPWLIRLTPTAEGGWKIRIKGNAATYRPSKHDTKIQETVEIIGGEGWFFKADAENGVITVYPGVPPTFPAVINPPKEFWKKSDLRHAYFGMKLPDRGRETGDLLYNDWKDASGVLVAGASNGGKSVVINCLVYAAVSAGCQLAVCDDKYKSVDFKWCRPWVIDHGWGCDSMESCAATLQHILDLSAVRANVINQYGKENWWGLPEDVRKQYPPILLVCDEIAQWAAPLTVPPGLSKDNPTRIKAEYEKGIRAMNYMALLKICQTVRFSGIFFMYAAQSATSQNGLDPSVRTNLPSKILLGDKVNDTVRGTVLNDAKNAPTVPSYLIEAGVSRGCGIAELVGQEACVYKGFYEDDHKHGKSWSDILREHMMDSNPPKGNDEAGHWSWNDIIVAVPAAAEKPDDGAMYEDDDHSPSRLETEGGFGEDGRDVADRDEPLKGAAAAAHASKLYAAGVDVPHVSAVAAARSLAKESAQQGL